MNLRLNALLPRLVMGTCIPLVLFVMVALVAAIALERQSAALWLEQHSHQVVGEVLRLRQNFHNMRLAYQGFVLTNAAALRTEFQTNHAEFQRRTADLRQQVQDNAVQVERIDHISGR